MYKILFSLLLIFLSGCSREKEPRNEVLVSIPPYLYFGEALTDGMIQGTSLVPVGANPHLYDPTPKQVQQAKEAKVWIRLSDSFEQKIEKSLKGQNKDLIIVNLANSPDISYIQEEGHVCEHGHHHGECKDLHIWLSLKSAKVQAEMIAEALIKAFPQKKELIEKNLLILKNRFAETDRFFTERLAPFKGDAILVSHPAFGYFCRDYDLKQIPIEIEGKDPLPKQLDSILALAGSSNVRTVFTQAQYNNKGALLIAKQLHLPVHEIDPYSPNYLENLETIVHDIVEP